MLAEQKGPAEIGFAASLSFDCTIIFFFRLDMKKRKEPYNLLH